jgi:signal transduction histidine kinase
LSRGRPPTPGNAAGEGPARRAADVTAATGDGNTGHERAALRRIARVAAEGRSTEALFDAVTAAATALTGAMAAMGKFEHDRTGVVVVARTDGALPVGFRFAVDGDIISARVARSGQPQRIDHYAEVAGAEFVTDRGLRAGVAVPVVVGGNLWGLLAVASTSGPLTADTEDRLSLFAEIVAAAIAGAEARDDLRAVADEQAALLRVAALVAGGASENEIFEAVATEAAALIDEEATTLVRYEGARIFTVLAERHGKAPAGFRFTVPDDDAGTLDEMMRTLEPSRRNHHEALGDRSFSWKEFDVGSSVSIPILVEGRLWGSLGSLTEGRELPAGTEQRLVQFAELISMAIANVHARAQLQRYATEQAALRRVAELVARGSTLPEVFDAVAVEASTILGGAPTNLARYADDFSTCTAVSQCGDAVRVGVQVLLDEDAPTLPMIRSRKPIRISTFTGTARADHAHALGVDAMVAVPVLVEDRVWGVLSTVSAGSPPPPDAEERLTELADLAGAAIASAENREKLRASRARVVATADETRRRLQRDVHDGAQQRLVQTVLTLRLALGAADRGDDTAGLVGEALQHAERATVELRDLVRGILPATVTRGGLRVGLESLIADLALPVDLDLTRYPSDRLPGEVEVTAYFVVAEALTNVVKHAEATRARITLVADPQTLAVEVHDDGIGGAHARGGTGLVGLTDRVEAMNGSLAVSSPVGRGTTLSVTLPLPGDGHDTDVPRARTAQP